MSTVMKTTNANETEVREPTLEEQISSLIAEQVRGGMSDDQQIRFLELTAQRSRLMRPTFTRRSSLVRKFAPL